MYIERLARQVLPEIHDASSLQSTRKFDERACEVLEGEKSTIWKLRLLTRISTSSVTDYADKLVFRVGSRFHFAIDTQTITLIPSRKEHRTIVSDSTALPYLTFTYLPKN